MSENAEQQKPDAEKDIYAAVAAEVLLNQVKTAVRGYHFALDMRHNATSAAHQALDHIMTALDMPYVQGDEQRRRTQGSSKK